VPQLALSPQGTPVVAFAGASEVLLASRSSAKWTVEPVYEVSRGSPRPALALDSEGLPHIWVTSSVDGSSVAYLRRVGDRWDEFPWSLGDRAARFGVDAAGVAHVFHQIEKTVFHATLSCQGLAR
jgi:hypothetical protein